MEVRSLQLGALQTNCWVVSDGLGGDVVVIDPGGDIEVLMRELGGARVAAVVLTHGHFDHLGAAAQVVERTGAPLLVHEADADRITHASPHGTGGELFGFDDVAPDPDRTLTDGEVLVAGALKLTCLHTPGHTQGSMVLLATDTVPGATPGPDHLFSGDTLFAGSVGRTDFPGGDGRALARSIAEKLAPLAPETVVHPGHGPDTTIGREARLNPFWPRG